MKLFLKIPWINSSTINQYLATFAVNILSITHGCAIGWSSPMIPYLKSEDTHLNSGPINATEASWIGSAITLGALVNIFIIGKVADYIGKKKCLIILCLPNLAFYILTYMATNVNHLYAARAVAGFTGGGLLRIVPLFIGEIAESHVRGKLGAYFPLGMNFGIFLMYVLGTYLDYHTISFVMVPFVLLYAALMLFLPDTPQFLIKKHRDEKALKSLKFYRNCNEKDSQNIDMIKKELESLKINVLNHHKTEVKLKDFTEKASIRGLLIGVFLMAIMPFSGNMTILSYTADIFDSSGSSLSANESSIIIGCIQFIGIYIASLFVDKFGRKILMSISCLGSGLSLLLIASYSYVTSIFEVPSSLSWIPIVSLSLTILLNSIGISSLPFMIVTELVPQKIRETSVTILMACMTLFVFTNLKVFPPLVEVIDLYGCMFIYAGFCIVGSIVTIFIMPETKGKNLFQNHES
ncbi:hypothetical protein ACKWTF_013987 [Chironomus riparius]